MEIIFIPVGKSEDLMNNSLEEIQSDELEEIKNDLKYIDSEYSLQEKNFGEGADWIMILAIINGLTSVFLLGDKINTGLDGWIKIGERINNIFSKSDRAYVDMEAAKILGIKYLADKFDLKSVRVVLEAGLPIKDLSVMLIDRKSDDFISKPFSVYLVTYEINDHRLVTLGIRSDGKISEHYDFDKDEFLPF